MDEDEISGYYYDDGTKINPDLISKPSLCVSCKKDDDPDEEMLCNLNRIDQQMKKEFICFAYEQKNTF